MAIRQKGNAFVGCTGVMAPDECFGDDNHVFRSKGDEKCQCGKKTLVNGKMQDAHLRFKN